MSTKSSFKAALEQRAAIKAGARDRSASPTVRLILRTGEIARPIDVARLLTRYGLSLRKAHEVLNRLAEGATVAVELHAANRRRLVDELSDLGVRALPIRLPKADVKEVREHFGLSQAEFALRFGFEIDTVQNWEQGRNTPDQATQLLLKVIEAYPDEVEKVLTEDNPVAGTTLDQMIRELQPDRRKRIAARAEQLIAEEAARITQETKGQR